MAYFEIQNLTFSFPNSEKAALSDVTFSVERGEYLLLCGHSGSGKTTLLRHLKPSLSPHGTRHGEILFCGNPLMETKQIGFVMQNPDAQIVTDKVWHELAFGLENLGTEPTEMRLRVAETANYFGIANWFHRETATLSGGEKQLLNLASVMAMQPDILILDEPTAQLDPIAATNFLATVEKLNRELGTTVILSEHRLEEIYATADRVLVLSEGRVAALGTPRQVCRTLPMPLLPTPLRVFLQCGDDGQPPLTVREGRRWLETKRTTVVTESSAESEVASVLEMKEVWFRYEKNSPDILKGVNLQIPTGKLFALVGENGSGKSTLLKSICGVCKPYLGKIKLFGENIKKTKKLFCGGICMLPQNPKSLFSHENVQGELEEMSGDFAEAASLCEIVHLLHRHPYDLSGGEMQRVALSKVLLTKPRLLLLDEPTKGFDNVFKQYFAEMLCKLKKQGITILMVSHDIDFCAQHADMVGMFFDGQILASAPPRQFFAGNQFYTTAARRMSCGILPDAVTAEDIVRYCRSEGETC